jgi:hypothetical protein
MNKISAILLILTMTITEAKSQEILDKWYGIGENNLAEFIVDKDSIKVQMLDSRQSNTGHERGNIKHFGIYDVGDKTIIVVADKSNKEEQQYLAMTFFNVRENQSIELAANGQTKPTKTIKELIDAIGKDETKLFGNVFYSEEKIKEFERLKDLETMSLDEFKRYLKKFIEKRDRNSFMEQLMTGTFRDQIINKTLIELGYNPMFRKGWENRFFEKYLSDKDVGEIYREKL